MGLAYACVSLVLAGRCACGIRHRALARRCSKVFCIPDHTYDSLITSSIDGRPQLLLRLSSRISWGESLVTKTGNAPAFFSVLYRSRLRDLLCHRMHRWPHRHPPIAAPLTSRPCGGPRVVVSTAAFHAKLFLPHPRVKVSIVGSLRDREVACSASDRQGSNFESCVWRTVSSQSSHHPQEVLLAQFSLYVHKGGLKPDSFHFISVRRPSCRHLRSRVVAVVVRLWSVWGWPAVVPGRRSSVGRS